MSVLPLEAHQEAWQPENVIVTHLLQVIIPCICQARICQVLVAITPVQLINQLQLLTMCICLSDASFGA